jgi:hypothetical protein
MMPPFEETGTFALRRPLTVSGRADTSLNLPVAGYGMTPTGEPARPFVREQVRPRRNGRKGAAQEVQAPETRAARRAAWGEARAAATALLDAIEEDDAQARFLAADDLDQALGKLWALRAGRDDIWKMILNHAQGLLRQLFKEKLVEALTRAQGAAIRGIVEDHLGPATKSKDDLNEVVRLIGDAGCDPYYAISGDPEDE